jgi:hypothetical protein
MSMKQPRTRKFMAHEPGFTIIDAMNRLFPAWFDGESWDGWHRIGFGLRFGLRSPRCFSKTWRSFGLTLDYVVQGSIHRWKRRLLRGVWTTPGLRQSSCVNRLAPTFVRTHPLPSTLTSFSSASFLPSRFTLSWDGHPSTSASLRRLWRG